MDLKVVGKKEIFRLTNWRNGGKKAYHKSGDKVLLFNSRVHLFYHGKLRSKWKDPYLVLHAVDHDTVNLHCNDGNIFKANGQCLKLFLEPNPQDFEELDVLNFLELE
jgi:hypothetical protein